MGALQLSIDKNVPIPTSVDRQGSNITLLKSMQPGDSVFFDKENVKKASRFYRVAKKLGIKILIRKEFPGGLRMWRIAEADKTPAPPVVTARVLGSGGKPNKVSPKARQAAKRERDKRYRAKKKAGKPEFPNNL